MRRLLLSLSAVAMVLGFVSVPTASAQQSVNLFLGGFTPTSLDGRDSNDVILNDTAFLTTLNRSSTIDMNKFNNVTFGGEWLFGLGNYFEGGLGLSYYQKSVPTVDIFNVDANTGDEFEADLKMKVVPFSATVRFLPLGHNGFEPYIGGGMNAYYWRYSETGTFVDYSSQPFIGPCPAQTGCGLVTGSFVGSGGAVGPVFLAGVRFPVGSVQPGFEVRHQWGVGDLPGDQGFAGSKIDLGGTNYLFTLNIRF